MIHNFNVNLAVTLGINQAILLNNLYYWIEKNRANNKHYYDGRYWTYNSAKAFCDMFPYMSERAIRYALEGLVEKGIIIKGNYNKLNCDRTLWYAITDYGYTILQNCQMELTNLSDGSDKIVRPIPNNNTDNKEIYNNKLLYTKKKEKKEFVPPTLEEIKEYCLERKNNVNWKKFYDYYTENNWKDAQGKQVNNWKLKVISWEGTSTNTFNKNNQVRNETKLPSWFGKDIQPTESTEEEKAEMERVMAELNSLL